MSYPPQPVEPRFWAKVYKSLTGCWLWKGTIASTGYGILWVGGKSGGYQGVHRISWELHFGKIPNNLWVLHKCDTPNCVNPEHLFLGTNADNSRDRALKGRAVRGTRHPNYKLTEIEVRHIRHLRKTTARSWKDIAAMFSVSPTLVRNICLRTTWKHVQ